MLIDTNLIIYAVQPDRGGLRRWITSSLPCCSVIIVCLEDGKKLKMLKRHLQSSYGLTPDEYRAKWGLPAEYPMVAPNYAKARSDLAHQLGFGRKRQGNSRGQIGWTEETAMNAVGLVHGGWPA